MHMSFSRILEKDFLVRGTSRNKVKVTDHWRVQLNRFDNQIVARAPLRSNTDLSEHPRI